MIKAWSSLRKWTIITRDATRPIWSCSWRPTRKPLRKTTWRGSGPRRRLTSCTATWSASFREGPVPLAYFAFVFRVFFLLIFLYFLFYFYIYYMFVPSLIFHSSMVSCFYTSFVIYVLLYQLYAYVFFRYRGTILQKNTMQCVIVAPRRTSVKQRKT